MKGIESKEEGKMREIRVNKEFDEFLHKIQQPKMKELWDNKEDDGWNNYN